MLYVSIGSAIVCVVLAGMTFRYSFLGGCLCLLCAAINIPFIMQGI